MWQIIVGIYLVLLLLDYSFRIRYHFNARSRGCATAPMHWFDLTPFGLYKTFEALYNYIKVQTLESIKANFVTKHTHINWFSGGWAVMSCNPDVIKATLATSFKDFSLGKRYPMFYPLLGNGIFTLSGEGWKHSRSLLRPQFSRDQISHLQSIKHHADLLIDRLLSESRTGTPDAQSLFFSLTLDTATEFLCGESAGTLTDSTFKAKGPTRSVSGQEFGQSFARSQWTLGLRFLAGGLHRLVDGRGFRNDIDVCKNYIDSYVYKALEKPMEKDEVADKYIFVRELTKETRDPVIIRDQAFNIMLAGRDTTAATMSFLTCYLGKYPEVFARLKREVLEHFGTDGSTITFESLKRCKYLSNVINETLRLNPIVPLNFRYATKDTVLPTGGGPNEDQPIFLPKGGLVFYSVYAMHRSERYWGPDADQFNPDRWDDTSSHSHQWDFLPFNGGPRICLGQQFALTEMACVFVRICQRVNKIEVLKDGPPEQLKQLVTLTASVNGGVPSKWT